VDSPDEILQTQGWLDAYTTASHASKIMTEDWFERKLSIYSFLFLHYKIFAAARFIISSSSYFNKNNSIVPPTPRLPNTLFYCRPTEHLASMDTRSKSSSRSPNSCSNSAAKSSIITLGWHSNEMRVLRDTLFASCCDASASCCCFDREGLECWCIESAWLRLGMSE